jgi:hypothetical protein
LFVVLLNRLMTGRTARLGRVAAFATAFAAAFAAGMATAHADGAFPDSGQVLLPEGRPDEITLGTNFGLIATTDGGKTWEWTCETALTTSGQAYQLGGSRDGRSGRIVASSLWGVVYSDDASCSFAGADGDITETVVTDLFVDRVHPERVYAIGYDDRAPAEVAFRSSDGGGTFAPAFFTAPADTALLGVEGAASDASTIYLTLHDGAPSLVRTVDGGGQWAAIDLGPVVGDAFVRIIAVDPTDPRKIFLRASASAGDRLVVSADGGATFATPLAVDGGLSAFVRRANGTILLAGTAADGTSFGARSFDGGVTFEPWAGLPHVRALAERDGVLYSAADDVADGFALAVSSDDGASWRPLLAYRDVTRIRPCVAAACRETCRGKAAMGLWSAAVCGDGAVGSGDAGSGAASRDASSAERDVGAAGPSMKPAGCSFSREGGGHSGDEILALGLMGLVGAALRTRARRG